MQPKVNNGPFDGKRKSTGKRLFCFSPTPCLLVVAYKLDFEDFIQHNAHCFQTTSTCVDFLSSQSIYSVPTMIKKSSVNHLVDELVSKSEEPFSVATSYYLLISNHGCQTTWHTDFSSTSVFYTVLTGSKTFFLVAPTENNMELFNTGSQQERDDMYVVIIHQGISAFVSIYSCNFAPFVD